MRDISKYAPMNDSMLPAHQTNTPVSPLFTLVMKLKLIEYPQADPEPPVGEEINKFRAPSQVRSNNK